MSRHGLYALVRCLMVRPVLIGGLCIALILGVLSTQFVLNVRVVGVEQEQALQIIDMAGQCGAKRGALWAKLDQQELQRQLEMRLDIAQKVLVHKRGVVMEIEVIPYVEGPTLFQRGDVCDIVANQTAVVESIIALEGTPCVEPGDVVYRGDVLIRGTYMRNIDEGKQRFVQARGIVMGRVSYMGRARVCMAVQMPKKTGRTEAERTLDIAGWKIPVSKYTTFEDSVLINQSETVLVGSVLPATVTTRTYAEVLNIPGEQTYAEAEVAGIAYAKEDAQSKMPAGLIVARQTVYSEMTPDGAVEVRVYLTAVVNIAMENKQMITEPLLYIPKWW